MKLNFQSAQASLLKLLSRDMQTGHHALPDTLQSPQSLALKEQRSSFSYLAGWPSAAFTVAHGTWSLWPALCTLKEYYWVRCHTLTLELVRDG